MKKTYRHHSIVLGTLLIMLTACEANQRRDGTVQPSTRVAASMAAGTEPAIIDAPASATAPSIPALPVYYWPAALPPGLEVDPALADVAETGYVLETTTGSEQTVLVVAGTTIKQRNVLEPGDVVSKEIMVRGGQGRILSNGNGYSIFWEEQGVRYAVLGTGLASHEIQAVVEGLERVNRDEVQDRLQELR